MYSITSRTAEDSFNLIADKIANHKKFYFIRFGDGEFMIMQQQKHRNHHPSDELTAELKEAFLIKDPNYLVATCLNIPKEKMASRGVCYPFEQNDELIDYVLRENLVTENSVFENHYSFTYMAFFKPRKTLRFFNEHIRNKKIMFIGGSKQQVAEKLYGPIKYYIATPPRYAYDEIDSYWPTILKHIDDTELVIVSAGVASNVIAKRLWMLDKEVQLLDIGSIIDAVEGMSSRNWNRILGYRVNKILPKNKRNRSISFFMYAMLKDIKYFFRRQMVR